MTCPHPLLFLSLPLPHFPRTLLICSVLPGGSGNRCPLAQDGDPSPISFPKLVKAIAHIRVVRVASASSVAYAIDGESPQRLVWCALTRESYSPFIGVLPFCNRTGLTISVHVCPCLTYPPAEDSSFLFADAGSLYCTRLFTCSYASLHIRTCIRIPVPLFLLSLHPSHTCFPTVLQNVLPLLLLSVLPPFLL